MSEKSLMIYSLAERRYPIMEWSEDPLMVKGCKVFLKSDGSFLFEVPPHADWEFKMDSMKVFVGNNCLWLWYEGGFTAELNHKYPWVEVTISINE